MCRANIYEVHTTSGLEDARALAYAELLAMRADRHILPDIDQSVSIADLQNR